MRGPSDDNNRGPSDDNNRGPVMITKPWSTRGNNNDDKTLF